MPKQYFNGKPIGYKISYHPLGLEENIIFRSVNFTTNTELTNLTAFTVYVIYVSAVSSGGAGPTNKIKARTDDTGTTNSLSILALYLNYDQLKLTKITGRARETGLQIKI